MYEKLREFELRLPRKEVEEVDALRENWTELMELAEQVREVLLKERRGAFEQELDKQVKVKFALLLNILVTTLVTERGMNANTVLSASVFNSF